MSIAQSSHNFAHVTTAHLLKHVLKCDMIWSSEASIIRIKISANFRFQLRANKPVEWPPVHNKAIIKISYHWYAH